MKKHLCTFSEKLTELDCLISNLYDDKVAERIPDNVFDRLLSQYETECIDVKNSERM